MNVIVIGSGAREHALCRILDKSYLCEKVFCFPGNYGISQIAECRNISTKEDIIRECIKINPDLVVVGPENYLSENIAGELRNNGLNVFGPDSKGAKLESSKEFMKEFCQSHDIATAKSQTFVDFEKAKNYLMSFSGPIVVKYDGLAAGKGVFVCADTNEAIEACERVFINKEFNQENNKVVIEDFIEGRELSFFTITDGEDYLNFGSAQDYKRIGDNDTGPNTGGMGTISPAPILEEELNNIIQEEIVKKTINGLKHDNIAFQGVIFFGIIVNEYNQPYLLEYNTRFGDPEIQSISLRVKSDFLALLHSTATKNLKYSRIEFYENKKSICLILATKGYPENYPKNTEIRNISKFENNDDFYIFHAATKLIDNKIFSNGGRVLSIVASGNDYLECRKKVYEIADMIDWPEKYYRSDIGANF